MKRRRSGSASNGGGGESEDYRAYLLREQRESEQHYLKPYRTRLLLCWAALAASVVVAALGNLGYGMLLGLPPVVYLRTVYATAYSPDQMGISRGQALRMVFIEVPLALWYLMFAISLV
jgi:hypothetical protein